MALYKLLKNPIDGTTTAVLKQDNPDLKVSIPFDPENIDYQDYLTWVADGNTPEAAD